MLDGWILGLSVDPSLMPFVPSQQGSLAKLQHFTCETVDELEKDNGAWSIETSQMFIQNSKSMRHYINV